MGSGETRRAARRRGVATRTPRPTVWLRSTCRSMVGDKLTTDEELQEFLCSSSDSRFSANPHELALALKTHDVIMHIYPSVQAALSAANWRPIEDEAPLKIGEDAWSQPWN